MKAFLFPQIGFWPKFAKLAVPITLQMLLYSANGMIDMLMVGQLDHYAIAALALCSALFIVSFSVINGMSSGVGILAAQYFGAKDFAGVRKSLIQGVFWATLVALPIFVLYSFFSYDFFQLILKDHQVILYCAQYMQITALSALTIALYSSLQSMLSAIGKPTVALFITIFSVFLNAALNYVLIFGHFGAPAMGLSGAALATVLSFALQPVLLLLYLRFKIRQFWPKWTDCQAIKDNRKIEQYLKISVTVSINGFLWAAGAFIYNIIYESMGAQELAVMGIMSPIITLCFASFWGVAQGCGILVGQELGAKNFDLAWRQSKLLLALGVFASFIVVLLLWAFKDFILSLFGNLSADTIALCYQVLPWVLVTVGFRAVNVVIIFGTLRAGGDTKFVLYMDVATQWLLGIPLAYLAANEFHWALWLVFLCAMSEEILKTFLCLFRLWQRKWMKHLVTDARVSA